MLAVIGAHAAGWPRGGFAGVDVFFVISGFVITGSLLREQREAARISLARFYARRARRLMPAAIVTIAAVVGVGFALYPRIRAEEVFADGVASMLFASNWWFAAQGMDYFAATTSVSPLQHFWSLSVEEQFYLLWPGLLVVLILCLPRAARAGRGPAVLTAVAAAAVCASSFGVAVVQSAHQLVSNAYTLARSADGRDLSASDLVAAEAAEAATYGMAGGSSTPARSPAGMRCAPRSRGRCRSATTRRTSRSSTPSTSLRTCGGG